MKTLSTKLIVALFFLPWIVLSWFIAIFRTLFCLTIEFAWSEGERIHASMLLRTSKFVENIKSKQP